MGGRRTIEPFCRKPRWERKKVLSKRTLSLGHAEKYGLVIGPFLLFGENWGIPFLGQPIAALRPAKKSGPFTAPVSTEKVNDDMKWRRESESRIRLSPGTIVKLSERNLFAGHPEENCGLIMGNLF